MNPNPINPNEVFYNLLEATQGIYVIIDYLFEKETKAAMLLEVIARDLESKTENLKCVFKEKFPEENIL